MAVLELPEEETVAEDPEAEGLGAEAAEVLAVGREEIDLDYRADHEKVDHPVQGSLRREDHRDQESRVQNLLGWVERGWDLDRIWVCLDAGARRHREGRALREVVHGSRDQQFVLL